MKWVILYRAVTILWVVIVNREKAESQRSHSGVTAESQRSHIGGAILKNLEKSRVKMTWDF